MSELRSVLHSLGWDADLIQAFTTLPAEDPIVADDVDIPGDVDCIDQSSVELSSLDVILSDGTRIE